MPVIPGAEPFFHSGGSTGVLLCHGFTGSPASLRPWAGHLSAAGLPSWYARQLLAAQQEGAAGKTSANDRLVMGIVGIGSPQSRSLQVVNESGPSVKAGQLTFTLGCDVDESHRRRATWPPLVARRHATGATPRPSRRPARPPPR